MATKCACKSKAFFVFITVCVFLSTMVGCGGSSEISSEETSFFLDVNSFSDSDIGPIDAQNLKLQHGDLISLNYGGNGIFVVKAKISPSYSNEATIHQNYFSVCKLIKKHGFDACPELQYWAVADMADGSESKVISFTLDSEVIKSVADETIIENQLGNYVDDLYILPSLLG